MAQCGIYHLVNLREEVAFLWINPIRINIINAHLLIFINFFNKYNIR